VAEWRRRLRLLHAVRLLAEGEPVTAVALEVGYSSVSAFIAVFRKEFGTTPGRYLV
jgi:AraC-like DNA-binding protein